jgi:glycosyltransferase involved in cell wall biosynthesis
MTDQYVAAGIAPRDKFVTIYSGMNVEPFLSPPRSRTVVRTELGLSPTDLVVGKIARLFPLKGHEFVIAAARSVVARHPEVKFLFVGDGILRDQFQRSITELGLKKNFVFAGLVAPEQVPELIHAMDVVVHTSLWEGLARVLPQALIAGKPVVSYDVDGAREVVLSGVTGYLLPPQSVDELSEAINILLDDSNLRASLGNAGRARFTDIFRHETMTRRIREVYADILAHRSGPSTSS